MVSIELGENDQIIIYSLNRRYMFTVRWDKDLNMFVCESGTQIHEII